MTARLTVLGGYLGAGKTTLLNGLLATADGSRIAVVVNDFGSVNIDRRLITSTTRDTVELANGCMCCSLQDDTSAVMTRLAERDDLRHVVVETSGVGDPAALRAWGNYPGFAPGSTVVCVDSTSAGRLMRDEFVGDTAIRQLSRADVVVLTKVDLARPEQLAEARRCCREHAPDAEVLRSARGDLRLEDLLLGSAGPGNATEGELDPHRSVHHSATVAGSGPVARDELLRALHELPSSVVRVKGLLRCRDSPSSRTVVQCSGGRVSVTVEGAWQEADVSELVIIAAGAEAADADLRSAVGRLSEVLADRG